MDEHFFKGQRVISPAGKGEVVDAMGDKILVRLDNGNTETFPAVNLEEYSSPG